MMDRAMIAKPVTTAAKHAQEAIPTSAVAATGQCTDRMMDPVGASAWPATTMTIQTSCVWTARFSATPALTPQHARVIVLTTETHCPTVSAPTTSTTMAPPTANHAITAASPVTMPPPARPATVAQTIELFPASALLASAKWGSMMRAPAPEHARPAITPAIGAAGAPLTRIAPNATPSITTGWPQLPAHVSARKGSTMMAVAISFVWPVMRPVSLARAPQALTVLPAPPLTSEA